MSKIGKKALITSEDRGTSKGREASMVQEAPPEKKVWTHYTDRIRL